MVRNPSIVIGVGEAGCRIASRVHDSIEAETRRGEGGAARPKEDVLDRFKFVGIDTKADEVEEYTSDAFETIALDPPHRYWEDDRQNHSYLREDARLADVGGATRQRAVSRYYVDNLQNYERFYRQLQGIVDEFEDTAGRSIDNDEINAANVWIINSLGGGTGSGSFPILSAMLTQIISNADEEYYLCGIGSLPRLDTLDANSPPPNANTTFYANAYAALRELAVLTDYEFDGGFADAAGTDFPIEIPIESKDKLQGYTDLRLESPPFDFYGLVGYDEEEANAQSNYRKNLNQVAADLVRLMSEVLEEDFPNGYTPGQSGKPDLFSVDSRGVEVPVTEVERYVDALESIAEIDGRLESTREERDRLRDNRAYLNELRDMDPDDEPIGNGETNDGEDVYVDRSLVTVARERADAFDPGESFSPQLLDEAFQDVLSQSGTLSERYEFDMQTVAAYLYYQELVANLREKKAGHRFTSIVEQAINDHSNRFDRILGADAQETLYSSEDPLTKWDNGLKEFFDGIIDDQREKLDSTASFRVLERREIKSRIESLKKQRSDLVDQCVEFTNLDEAQSTAAGRFNQARTTIDDTKEEINGEIADLEDEIESLKQERGRREQVQESRRDDLRSYDRDRYVSIPFEDFEDANSEFLRELDSIGELVEQGVVTRRKLARAFEYQIDRMEEPTQDLETFNIQRNTYRYLGLLVSDENVSLLEGDLDDIEGVTTVSKALNTGDELERAVIDDAFRVRMTAAYADIALENTSEFGQIHEFYTDPDRQVGDLLGSGEDDMELIASKFAYPELFPDDDRIQEQFGLDEPVSRTAEDD